MQVSAPINKILIIGPSWVGDMVMSQSLYIRLAELYPNAKIDVLAPAWCKPILERMPQINQAIEMPVGHGEVNLSTRWKIAQGLKSKAYDHAFVLPNSAKSALIPVLAGISRRTGWKGEMRYGLLNDLRPNKTQFQYMVERYVALASTKQAMCTDVKLETCPHPSLSVNKENQRTSLTNFGIDANKPIIGLCPGAEFGPAKRWPDNYYAQVADKLIEQGNQILLFGGAKDIDVTAKIKDALVANKAMCFNLAGQTSLNDAVDLLAACHTVITNDSGLMHVAAAVNCNIVAIYGSTSQNYTPPLSKKVQIVHTDIECRPCFKRECPLGHLKCLKELLPEQVINAYQNLMSN